MLHLETVVALAKMVLKDEQQVAIAQGIATDCSAITDSDRCELAYKLLLCALDAADKRGVKFSEFM